jgi:uncharacterized Zn finger protein (UPF0148 family)
MSSSQSLTPKQRMEFTAEMMRLGATLLREACPKCGGVQIKFQGKIFCTNEDDLEAAVYPDSSKLQKNGEEEFGRTPESSKAGVSQESSSVITLLEQKLAAASKLLENSTDFEEQTKLLDLISKYVETIGKLKKSS